MQQFAFFLTLWVLPQVFNNKGYLSVTFIVYFLASSYLISNTACPPYRFVKDKALGLIIIYDLNISLAV